MWLFDRVAFELKLFPSDLHYEYDITSKSQNEPVFRRLTITSANAYSSFLNDSLYLYYISIINKPLLALLV